MVAPEPEPSDEELQALRERLFRNARVHLQSVDAEDITQEALLRVVRDHPAAGGAPLLAVRAHVKLRDARSEFFRKRVPTPVEVAEPSRTEVDHQAASMRLVEIEDVVRRIAGPDVLQYSRWKAERMTDADIAEQPGWNPRRAARARKQLARKRERLADELLSDKLEVDK